MANQAVPFWKYCINNFTCWVTSYDLKVTSIELTRSLIHSDHEFGKCFNENSRINSINYNDTSYYMAHASNYMALIIWSILYGHSKWVIFYDCCQIWRLENFAWQGLSRPLFLNRWLLVEVHFKFLLRPDLDVDINRLWWRGWFRWHNHLEGMFSTASKEHVSIVCLEVLSILTKCWFAISQSLVISHQTSQIPSSEFIIWKVGCDLNKHRLWKQLC